MKQYNVIDLFAGVGGLSFGFSKLPEFNIIAANEIEKDISVAYTLNHPNVKMINCDINDLTKEKLEETLDGQKVDIVVGGPPCQSYSTVGKRQMDDRANLFMQYKRVLQIIQPRVFVFERTLLRLPTSLATFFISPKPWLTDSNCLETVSKEACKRVCKVCSSFSSTV